MQGFANSVLTWLAPIAAGFLTLAGQLWLNDRFKRADEKRDQARADTDAKRAAEAEWRDSVDERLAELAQGIKDVNEKTNRSIAVQASEIRSDIIHKCHRYFDDLGEASIEEKDALHDEHEQYTKFCEDLDIDNNFIDNLVAKVMELPERKV